MSAVTQTLIKDYVVRRQACGLPLAEAVGVMWRGNLDQLDVQGRLRQRRGQMVHMLGGKADFIGGGRP